MNDMLALFVAIALGAIFTTVAIVYFLGKRPRPALAWLVAAPMPLLAVKPSSSTRKP